MKSKVLLFLFCFISNSYCMNSWPPKESEEKWQTQFRQKGRPRKKIEKKKFYYSVNCPKQGCSKKFERTERSYLIRPLLRHLYSQKHDPELYNKFYNRVKKDGSKVGRTWLIESGQQILKANNISRLTGFLMFHELGTKEKNPDGFKEMQTYVRENVKKLDI